MAILTRFFGRGITEAGGIAIGTPAAAAVHPLIQHLVNDAWSAHPERPLDPDFVAALVASSLAPQDWGAAEAARSGIDSVRFGRLVEGTRTAPPMPVAYEAWRRGELTGDEFGDVMERHGIAPQFRDALRRLRNIVPSVTDLVRMAVREVFDPAARSSLNLDAEFPGAFATRAAELGIAEPLARDYWAAHWDLPSYSQGVEMMHRGQLSPAQLDDLLKALDYAPTWRAKLRAIAQRIPPLGDMIRFAVREVYNPAQRQALGLDADYPTAFTAEAKLHGMDEERARQYWAAHWRLPSAQQGYRMLWRGEISPAQLDGLLKALDYPAVWRQRLSNIAHVVPGRIDLRRMFAADLIGRAELKEGYGRLGYADADAERMTLLAEELAGGAAGAKELTLAHWSGEYLGGYITPTQYQTRVRELGYDDAEAAQLVRLYDAKKVAQARDGAVSRIRTSFVGYQISRSEAAEQLQRTSIRPEARDRILAEWDIARSANVKQMTAAQVRAAFKKARYSRAQAFSELQERGWRDDDANAYLDTA